MKSPFLTHPLQMILLTAALGLIFQWFINRGYTNAVLVALAGYIVFLSFHLATISRHAHDLEGRIKDLERRTLTTLIQ